MKASRGRPINGSENLGAQRPGCGTLGITLHYNHLGSSSQKLGILPTLAAEITVTKKTVFTGNFTLTIKKGKHIKGNIGTELKTANVESRESEARYGIKSQVRNKKGFKFI